MAHKSTLLFGALALSLAAAQSQDLATCLQQGSTNDTVILPSSLGYEAAAYATFNQRLLYNPTAVVYPTTAQDIQRYVRCAAASGVPIAARSGGHSYASYDLGGVDGAIVVDLSNMTSVVVHDDGTAYVQTGNRLGDMARKLWDQGRRSVPHGFVETGHISFGGMGAWSRRHGLAQDRVIGAEIVLANGTILTASDTNQPDLFWAIRGAAPSFGIVTQWIMATLPTDPSVVTYTVDYDAVTNSTQLSQIFQRWQATVASAPDESWLASRVARATTASDLTLQLRGVYFGTQDQFNAYTANWTTLFSPGLTMTNDSVIPERWDSMCEYIFSAGMNASLPWWFESYSTLRGAISRQGTDATSFASRDALFSYQWWGYTPANTTFPSDGIPFVDGMLKALEPNPQKAYPNYVDPTLSADEWKQQYYGDHYERLARIKRAVDPNNVFRFAQSIEVAE
ncbi:Berberine and berberine like [Rhizoctonia solani]|uniref:Berberine and berberine like n=1 Tax=Rhizoctonia solani TaxID=456999 RepID=A0A8H7IAA1_9AGAM|nr:Berberine and berberine like [Rhizoctonia solani]